MLWNLAFCLALPWTGERGHAIIAALRGRTGVLATFNLIPSILFATRNNPLVWLLNVNYDTFMLFHRWIARLATAEAIIHTICWLVNTYYAANWAGVRYSLDSAASYRVAAVATCLLIFIVLQAWSPVRRAFYDTFVTFHRIAVYGALLCIYLHLYYHKLGQIPFMYAIFGILGFDHLVRIWGIFAYNFSFRGRHLTRLTVEALPGNVSKVTISLAKPWKARPGAIVHVYIPSLALWTSHPFSVAWYNNSGTLLRTGSEFFPATPDSNLSETTTAYTASVYSVNTQSEKNDIEAMAKPIRHENASKRVSTITLLVHARNGMTRKLYNRAKWHDATLSSPHYTTFGTIESPYSWSSRETRTSFDSYGTILLFAGGIGITGVLHQILEIASRARHGQNSARKVVLTWAVGSVEALGWVDEWVEEILYVAREVARLELLVQVFVNERGVRKRDVEGGKEEVSMPGWVHDARVKVEYRRCEVEGVVGDIFERRVGAMVVGACGPGKLADGVRKAIRARMGQGSIDLVEEGFSY